jgi:branched-chain amino acid transport system substrate-binding protein
MHVFFPTYCYDIGRILMSAIAAARPLTGEDVKESLERVKVLPAATARPAPAFGSASTYATAGWAANSSSPAACSPPEAGV